MKEEMLWELIARQLSGERDAEEELTLLRKNDPGLDKLLKETSLIWEKSAKLKTAPPALDIDNAMAKMVARVDEMEAEKPVQTGKQVSFQPNSRRVLLKVAAAAAVVLVAVASWFTIWETSLVGSQQLAAQTNNGERKTITLEDGTKVQMNVASTLTYPETFDAEERRVKLVGEAFFEVASDANRPFIIETDHTLTKVLGTSFNLRAYGNESTERITLQEGNVSFAVKAENKTVDLAAGELAQFQRETQALSKETVKPVEVAPWRDEVISFKDQAFREVVAELERWYDVTIIVKEDALLDKHFTGQFSDPSIEPVLSKICTALDIDFTQQKEKRYVVQ